MLNNIQKLILIVGLLTLNACASFALPEKEINSLQDVPVDHLLLVGKITLNPPLRDSEKNIKVPYDLFGSSEMMSNRAILGFNQNALVRLEKSGFLINPRMGETFFFAVPRDRFNMLGGYITVSYSQGTTINHGKVLIPPLQLDFKANDEIVYIGTLHLERGPFNDVVSVKSIDEYNTASVDLSKRFGITKTMRKALPVK